MRSSKSRSRGKNRNNNNRPQGNVVNRVFDSSGPEGKVRGTPQQIIEKYQQLHRDAQLSNDRVAAENFQQHAEHYARMLGEALKEQEAKREAHEAQQQAQRAKQQENQNNGQGNAQSGGNQGGGNRSRNRDDQPAREDSDQPDVNVDDMSPAALAAAAGSRAKPAKSEVDVIDLSEGSADDDTSTLVETAETKPKRKPRTRKPKVDPKAEKPDTPEAPAAE